MFLSKTINNQGVYNEVIIGHFIMPITGKIINVKYDVTCNKISDFSIDINIDDSIVESFNIITSELNENILIDEDIDLDLSQNTRIAIQVGNFVDGNYISKITIILQIEEL